MSRTKYTVIYVRGQALTIGKSDSYTYKIFKKTILSFTRYIRPYQFVNSLQYFTGNKIIITDLHLIILCFTLVISLNKYLKTLNNTQNVK